MGNYRSTPDQTLTRMPGGVPYIIGNELAERFSFYGMKGILTVFMTKHLLDSAGEPDYMGDEQAKATYHLFTAGAYFFPLIGAIISDVFWGKYKTILFISLMYCVGHGMLALMDLGPHLGLWDMKPFLFAGLLLIAIGAGGIKPCVSAHVGDQFGNGNKHLLTQIFNWFYFSINLGATAGMLLTPILLREVGPWLAFGLPGVLMAIATFVFWLGRNKFIHVPAAGWTKWKEETFSPEGVRALKNLAPLFLIFVPMFWAIFDQTGSAWVLQADKMNRDLGFVWLPSQIQAVNPILILTGIPIFTYIIYPFMGRFFEPTPLRKIGIGFVLTALAFGVSALTERPIQEKQEAVARAMFVELESDARAFTPPADADEAAARALAQGWTRAAMGAANLSGWEDEDLASVLGMTGDELEQFREANEPLAYAAVADVFRELADPTGDKNGGKINGAISAARNAGDDAGWTEDRIVGFLDEMPNIIWQFLAYAILTSGEIMVSIVCLEFAYTQSPRRMKSFIMGVYFLGVSLGNFYVSGVNFLLDALRRPDGTTPLDGENYYWFFAALMLVTTVIYVFFAKVYKGETFIQGDDSESTTEAQAEGTDPR